jgi:hypothetical protein
MKTFILFDIGRFWFNCGWFPGDEHGFQIKFYEKHYSGFYDENDNVIAITYFFLKIFKFAIGFGCEYEK